MRAIRLINRHTATDCRPSKESPDGAAYEVWIYNPAGDDSVILVGTLDNLERLGQAIASGAAWRREYERTGVV